MTSERPRFPLGLTLAAAIAFAVMIGLGVWQMQRLGWKHQELARIAALRNAPPQPIGPVLARAAQGQPVEFTRVVADCAPGSAAPPPTYRLTTDNGEWIARALAACRLTGGPYDGVVVDRGYLSASRGSTVMPTTGLPPPGRVVGVLFGWRAVPVGGLARPAPVVLSAESESPPPPGVTPAPFNANASDNLQYVGAYGPTWFGLAGVLACFYAAMLWRRNHPKKR